MSAPPPSLHGGGRPHCGRACRQRLRAPRADPGRPARFKRGRVDGRSSTAMARRCTSRGARTAARTSWMTADRLPATLVDATMAAEDRRFFRHPGIDPISVVRAAGRNVRSRRWVEGGSTITQQVGEASAGARRRAPGDDVPWPRGLVTKFREAVLALRLEHRLSKREILALYLNLAPYGNQLTGADRASRAYFGHGASLLTPAQAAFLAVAAAASLVVQPLSRSAPRAGCARSGSSPRWAAAERSTPERRAGRAARAAGARARSRDISRAAFRRPRARRGRPAASPADRHHARRLAAARGRGHHSRGASLARAAWRP